MSALNSAAKRRLIPFNPGAFVELATGKRPKAVLPDELFDMIVWPTQRAMQSGVGRVRHQFNR